MHVLNWLKQNGNRLSINIRLDAGFNTQFPKFHRAWGDICWRDRIFKVQGVAPNQVKAITICLAEFVERAVVVDCGAHSSNGFAAHTLLPLAFENARNELFERDAFFCHFLTSKPFSPINLHECIDLVDPFLKEFICQMQSFGVEIKMGFMSALGGDVGLIAAASGTGNDFKFGVTVETIYGNNLSELIEKLLLDLSSNLRFLYGNRHASVSTGSDDPDSSLSFETQFLLRARQAVHRDWFIEMFSAPFASLGDVGFFINEEDVEVQGNSLEVPDDLLNPPLVVVRAENRALQSHFLGQCVPEKANLQRLSDFSGRTLKFEDLSCLPSIFG